MAAKNILIGLVLLLLLLVPAVSAQVQPCKVGKQAPAIGFWTWPANTRVRVFIVARDFQPSEYELLLMPFRNWTAVSKLTGSGVTFDFENLAGEQQLCDNCLTLMRGTVFNKSTRHATELRAYSANSNQLITYAAIVVDSALTNSVAVADAIAHELGHSFSLLDCRSCKARTTLMTQFSSFNVANNLQSPTACDVEQVTKAYQALSNSVGPAPLARVSVDEGEEPIEDDTPIVVPKP